MRLTPITDTQRAFINVYVYKFGDINGRRYADSLVRKLGVPKIGITFSNISAEQIGFLEDKLPHRHSSTYHAEDQYDSQYSTYIGANDIEKFVSVLEDLKKQGKKLEAYNRSTDETEEIISKELDKIALQKMLEATELCKREFPEGAKKGK